IFGAVDHELQLIDMLRDEPADHVGTEAGGIMPTMPARLLLARRGGTGELRTDRHQVARHGEVKSACCLDRHMPTCAAEAIAEGNQLRPKHRLAPRDDHVLAIPLVDL